MAKPIFNNAQIITQLTTSWGDFDEGATETWNGTTVFYSIPTTSPDFTFPYTFSALFNPTTRELGRQAFELWDDLIAINLTETNDRNEQITLAWSSTGFSEGALGQTHVDKHGFHPEFVIDQARVWINANTSVAQKLNEVGVGGIYVFLHEIGHALGLSHPGSYNGAGAVYGDDAEYAQDTIQFSVMSYFDETEFGTAEYFNPDDTSTFFNEPSTPMLHDVMAIQAKYGADPNTRTGDTTYGFASTAGRTAFDFSINVDPVVTIYDAGGSDTLNASLYDHDQTISLVPGTYSSIGALTDNVAIAFNTVIENALGGSGDDHITGNEFANVLDGGGGDDVLIGGGGADGMLGGEGEDILDARASSTSALPAVLAGGVRSDTYLVGKASDIVIEDDVVGTDWVIAFGTSYTLSANVENLTLAPDGTSTNYVGTGNDLDNRIEGNNSPNTLLGLGGRDHLIGFDGNDDLTGGLGADELEGGNGVDRFIFLSGDDVMPALEANGSEVIDGGTNSGGFDGLVLQNTGAIDFGQAVISEVEIVQFFSGTSTAMFNANQIGSGGIGLVLGNGASVDTLVVDGTTINVSTLSFLTWAANDVIILNGTSAGETITGSSQSDTLNGFSGADTLVGGAGNDTLNGGLGADTLNGGTGASSIDTASYANAVADVNGKGVTVLLLNPSQNTGEAFGDTYNSIENLIGSAFDDILEGTTGANAISGGDGADSIAGGSGADVLDGGAGSDAFVFRSGSDVVAGESISGGSGFDALVLENAGSINFGSSPLSSVEILQFASGTSTATFTAGNGAIGILIGNAASVDTVVINSITTLDLIGVLFSTWATNDIIILNGTGGADTITGTGQNDTINGFGGGDTLAGGLGADVMAGGTNNDSYFVDNTGDAVTENANEGIDTVTASISFTLGANIENLTLTDGAGNGTGGASAGNGTGGGDLQGYGNTLDNTIVGNSGNNLLDGRAGVDTMAGAAGNDAYFVDNAGDIISENVNAGTDTVYSTAHLRLTTNVENLVLQGSADLQGYGNGLSNAIYGNSGNNLLDGDTGADFMVGGAGNDSYFVDNAGDGISENAGEGTDTIYSSAHLRLTANLENLVLQGSADLQAYGNVLSNSIYGNSGSNVLDGDVGADSMFGGRGNDTYYVDNIADVVVESANEGNDTVHSTASLTLGTNVETLILDGNGDLQGYGNVLSNSIYGNSGNNILDGGGAGDAMYGGSGNDIYFVDNAGDVIVENGNQGTDTVFSTVDITLAVNVEQLVLQGSAGLQGYGNSLSNALYGNSGNNLLNGGGAADSLTGNSGNDTFVFNAGQGNGDTIVDFAGNGAAVGDALLFFGYGAGANLTNIDATHWQVNYNGGASHDVITFSNAASINAQDFNFI